MSAGSIEIVGDEIPGKVRLTMMSVDGEWTSTYLDPAEVAAIHAAFGSFIESEVRGYVVLTHDPATDERYDVNWDGVLYADALEASAEADEAIAAGHPEAHVGVVTALPAEAEP